MKNLYLIAVILLLTAGVFAQAPQKMSYQTVIRNSSHALVSATTVGMKISILQGSSAGTAVYIETQTPVTSANGLASIEIGGGSVVSGSFADIDWANGPYFVKTEIDPAGGTSYSIVGTSQLLSVPYALHAKTAENGISTDQANAIAAIAAMQAQIDVLQKPQLYTTTLTNILNISAVSGGTITNMGLGDILARGLVWSTSPAPTIALNTKTTDGTGNGSFVSALAGLTPATTYYVRAYATNSAGTAYGNEISFTTLANPILGQTFGGGIVFSVDNSGHGLIAAANDQGSGPWGCESVGIGTTTEYGAYNTSDILAQCSQPGIAAEICANLSLNGYDDWYLPARDELSLMYLNIGGGGALGDIGGFNAGYYWSSTSSWQTQATMVEFQYGDYFALSKLFNYNVRAIRAF